MAYSTPSASRLGSSSNPFRGDSFETPVSRIPETPPSHLNHGFRHGDDLPHYHQRVASPFNFGQENVPTQHLLKLPKFSGEGSITIDDFCQEVELALSFQRVPRLQAVTYVLGALEGPARRAVIGQPKHLIDDVDKILGHLRETFGNRNDLRDLLAAYYNRHQQQGERAAEYANALTRLQTEVNRRRPGALTDEDVVSQFLKGLRNRHVRRHTALLAEGQLFVSLQACISRASVAEREEDDVASREDLERVTRGVFQLATEPPPRPLEVQRPPDVQQAAAAAAPPAPGSWICFWCERPGHRELECPTKQRYHQRRNQRRGRGGYGSRGGRGGASQRGHPTGGQGGSATNNAVNVQGQGN